MYRILLPTDGSDIARRGLVYVKRLADAGLKVEVRIVSSLEPLLTVGEYSSPQMVVALTESAEQAQRDALDRTAEDAKRLGLSFTSVATQGSNVAGDILAEAGRWQADQIVMGTHGRGALGQLVMGSVAQRVIHAATIPVTLVR
ncbi:MAG: universal stress protein [Lautropia sp.]